MYWQLIRDNRAFRVIASREVLTAFGGSFADVANIVLLLHLWKSPMAVACFMGMQTGIQGLCGLIGGNIIDRYPNAHVIVIADLLAVLCRLLLIGSAFYEIFSLFLVSNILFIVVKSISHPAADSYFPQVIDSENIYTANTMTETMEGFTKILSMGLGGFVTAFYGVYVAFLIDAGTYLVSALSVSSLIWCRNYYTFIEVPTAHKQNNKDKSSLRLIRDIFSYLFTENHVIIVGMLLMAWYCLPFAIIKVLNVSLAKEFFQKVIHKPEHSPHPFTQDLQEHLSHNYDGHHHISLSLGICYTVSALGSFLGPIITNYFHRKNYFNLGQVIGIGLFACVVGGFFISITTIFETPVTWLLGNFMYDAGSTIVVVFIKSLYQTDVQQEYRGRVFTLTLGFIEIGTDIHRPSKSRLLTSNNTSMLMIISPLTEITINEAPIN